MHRDQVERLPGQDKVNREAGQGSYPEGWDTSPLLCVLCGKDSGYVGEDKDALSCPLCGKGPLCDDCYDRHMGEEAFGRMEGEARLREAEGSGEDYDGHLADIEE